MADSNSKHDFVTLGKAVVKIEQQALTAMLEKIDHHFAKACELMLACQGRVVVIGMGKSGHIGNKIAATLASTGTPAFFVHPGEASHGDLGMITNKDVVVALSNSGETSEVTSLLPVIKRLAVPLISLTGKPDSTLAKFADVNLDTGVEKEACPMNLAPTASTTTALVMGDALAVALLEAKGFSENDFALSHPGGSLGRKLLLRVEDIMHKNQDVPKVTQTTTVSEALLEMTNKRLGMTCIVDSQNKLIGIFTDGDLRRILDLQINIHQDKISTVMTKSPTVANADMLAAQALNIMEEKKINGLVVVDDKLKPIGAMNMHDLLKSGVL